MFKNCSKIFSIPYINTDIIQEADTYKDIIEGKLFQEGEVDDIFFKCGNLCLYIHHIHPLSPHSYILSNSFHDNICGLAVLEKNVLGEINFFQEFFSLHRLMNETADRKHKKLKKTKKNKKPKKTRLFDFTFILFLLFHILIQNTRAVKQSKSLHWLLHYSKSNCDRN